MLFLLGADKVEPFEIHLITIIEGNCDAQQHETMEDLVARADVVKSACLTEPLRYL